MSNPLPIPQDIIDSVIEVVDATSTLKKCALVSSSFLLPSRQRLFSDIRLRNETQCKQLYSTLVENAFFLSLIIKLTVIKRDYEAKNAYFVPNPWFLTSASSLPAILRLPMHRLSVFSLISSPLFLKWERLSRNFLAALQNIIRLPSLTKLHLSAICGIPIPLLSDVGLVKHLVLKEVYLDIPDIVESQIAEDAAHLEERLPQASATGVERFTWKLRRETKFEGE
jgi:hypothetical protein